MRMLNPPHPDAFIRTEVIEPLGLTVAGRHPRSVCHGRRCPRCSTVGPICPA